MLKSAESIFGAALILFALVLFLSGMPLRHFGYSGGGWIEEVTIYLVAWGMLLAAASCVAHDDHVRTDFFIRILSDRLRHLADILAAISGIAFCFAMAWFGWLVLDFSLAWDERGPSFLQIPTAWYYAALPVSMLLCSLRFVFKLYSIVTSDSQKVEPK